MTEQEKSFIRNLVQSPNWQIIESLAKRIVDKINEESTVRDNEWDTLRTTLQKEGKVEGVKQLLSEMFNIGSK